MANSNQTPSGFAAATKVVVDSIKTTFGAAVVTLFFFGLALVILCSGTGGLDTTTRGEVVYLLIWLMIGILSALVLLRIFNPTGLAGPPQPETEQITIKNSTIEE